MIVYSKDMNTNIHHVQKGRSRSEIRPKISETQLLKRTAKRSTAHTDVFVESEYEKIIDLLNYIDTKLTTVGHPHNIQKETICFADLDDRPTYDDYDYMSVESLLSEKSLTNTIAIPLEDSTSVGFVLKGDADITILKQEGSVAMKPSVFVKFKDTKITLEQEFKASVGDSHVKKKISLSCDNKKSKKLPFKTYVQKIAQDDFNFFLEVLDFSAKFSYDRSTNSKTAHELGFYVLSYKNETKKDYYVIGLDKIFANMHRLYLYLMKKMHYVLFANTVKTSNILELTFSLQIRRDGAWFNALVVKVTILGGLVEVSFTITRDQWQKKRVSWFSNSDSWWSDIVAEGLKTIKLSLETEYEKSRKIPLRKQLSF